MLPAPAQDVALSFSLGAQAGCRKMIALTIVWNYMGQVWPSIIPADPMIASWNSGVYCTTSSQHPCRPHTDAGETHHLHCPFFVPRCPDKETSISRLRGSFMSAVHELTAVLIRFTKSFGIKVLSKYEMIKIQQQQKMQCPLYFLFWLGNQWC